MIPETPKTIEEKIELLQESKSSLQAQLRQLEEDLARVQKLPTIRPTDEELQILESLISIHIVAKQDRNNFPTKEEITNFLKYYVNTLINNIQQHHYSLTIQITTIDENILILQNQTDENPLMTADLMETPQELQLLNKITKILASTATQNTPLTADQEIITDSIEILLTNPEATSEKIRQEQIELSEELVRLQTKETPKTPETQQRLLQITDLLKTINACLKSKTSPEFQESIIRFHKELAQTNPPNSFTITFKTFPKKTNPNPYIILDNPNLDFSQITELPNIITDQQRLEISNSESLTTLNHILANSTNIKIANCPNCQYLNGEIKIGQGIIIFRDTGITAPHNIQARTIQIIQGNQNTRWHNGEKIT